MVKLVAIIGASSEQDKRTYFREVLGSALPDVPGARPGSRPRDGRSKLWQTIAGRRGRARMLAI
jgi:hypothetical protein